MDLSSSELGRMAGGAGVGRSFRGCRVHSEFERMPLGIQGEASRGQLAIAWKCGVSSCCMSLEVRKDVWAVEKPGHPQEVDGVRGPKGMLEDRKWQLPQDLGAGFFFT